MNNLPIDTTLDLVLEREIAVPLGLVWRGLTEPELIKQWFCPKPWGVSDCRVDLRPGGEFYTVMQDPEGNQYPGNACILEVEKERRFTWTSQLHANFRPATAASADDKECAEIPMTAVITLASDGDKTRYSALVMHNTEAYRKKHEAMGFYDGWGTTISQLEELLLQQN